MCHSRNNIFGLKNNVATDQWDVQGAKLYNFIPSKQIQQQTEQINSRLACHSCSSILIVSVHAST